MESQGWTLLFHDCIVGQLKKLRVSFRRAQQNHPQDYEKNTSVKLFRMLAKLIFDEIPKAPGDRKFRQGNTLGEGYRHWRRAKFGGRFRLFFRYDSGSKAIVFAWVSDEKTKRSSGSKSDPYVVFKKMLERGHPPDDWDALVVDCTLEWPE